ncbi:helix-turn-helix domain-containing protein [Rathayibacter sp. VKM Ac-2754]|uniref:helix-turn-helix domain-containing protein n=1 Tax=Rathayibacter sp. VKM Ac-2754 TaxID=2609251 RepID=UPI00135A7F61|nr:helix-turn-helix domain-containing protein [Rathayibacter sp. VKM Ac-2754]MWV59408.1 helix-turn-helix domain-containing protein [Rathayibacter sp. VKM Ac-2754]
MTDGLLELLLPPGGTALGRGQAVIALTSQTFRTKSTEQVATIEVELGEAFTERFTPTLLQGPVTIESNRVGIRAISVFVNEILTGVGSLETPLSGGYRRALESLVTDLLEESGRDVMPDIGAADRRLLLRARRLIQAGFADPRFSVARLADELSVSERQLQRAFSTVDSTPHRMLRLTRARAAAELLAAAPGATRADWDRVARRVGLPGARALKDHFRDLGMTAPDRRASS